MRRLLIVAFSAFCHLIAYVYILEYYQSLPAVLEQLRLLVIASFTCAGMTLLFRSRTVLAYAHGFRLFSVILAIAILEGGNLVVELLFMVPFLVETTDRFDWKLGLVISAFASCMTIFVDLLILVPDGAAMAIQHGAILLTVLIPISVMSCVLSRWSGILAERSRLVDDLGLAVQNLTNANKSFQDYAETIGSLSTEQERNRITRELHDLTGYALTNIIMLMNAGRVFLQENPEKLMEILDNSKQQADSALTETRRILYQLRSIKTPGLTGLHVINQLVRTFSDATNVQVSVNYGNFPMSYGEQIDGVIYRIIQEGLTNALKHGKARKITIILWQTETDIIVSVGDNGAGAGQVNNEGIGLRGIRERLSSFGGSLDAHSAVYGFELVARIPMNWRSMAKEMAHGQD